MKVVVLVLAYCINCSGYLRAKGSRNLISKAPYTVRLLKDNETTCSGVIIDPKWILTAAHCLPEKNNQSYQILGGIDDIEDGVNKSQSGEVETTIMHPKYKPKMFSKYDFGLIKLKSKFNLSENVQILPLSNQTWPEGDKYKQKCTFSGWGTNKNHTGGVKRLRIMNVVARHGEKGCGCFRSFHNRRVICLEEPGKGICNGDTGGPLVCNGKGVGIGHAIYRKEACSVSHIGPLPNSCHESISSFMYICPELSWIRSHVSSIPETPPSCKATINIPNFIFALVIFIKNMISN